MTHHRHHPPLLLNPNPQSQQKTMTNLVCAIQIGSSRILAIAAMKDIQSGALGNIQIESEPARDCISHGCIVNVEQTAMHIRSLIQKLSNRMRATISSAYVGVGGLSLHTLSQQPSVQIPDYDVLCTLPSPSGSCRLIVGQKHIRQRVQAAMNRAGINMIDLIVLPQATNTILSDQERQEGAMLVDMGASTTTISIYFDNELQHLAILPLGGETVTYDIQSACSSYDEAERIKVEWSDVTLEVQKDAASNANDLFADQALPMPQSKLNNIALCRYEEIAANIQHQLEISGLKDKLQHGCILTGGAAMQRGLTTLLRRRLSISRIETRAYRERAMLGSERKPHLTNVLALLSFCTVGCQAPIKPAKPAAAKPATARPASSHPKPAAVADASSDTTAAPSIPKPSPDGQLGLDIPEQEPEIESHSMREGIIRFAKDLFSGQK